MCLVDYFDKIGYRSTGYREFVQKMIMSRNLSMKRES